MNILDLRGPEFLQFYLGLLALLTVTALVLRYLLRGPGDEFPGRMPPLEPLEIAYLAGGAAGAARGAVAALVQQGALAVGRGTGRLSIIGPAAPAASPLEKGI